MSAFPAERLSDLPPSAKLVFLVLEHNGSLTQREIRDESLLTARTARYALSRLEEEGLVEERISFRDARQRIYSLSKAGETAADGHPAPC
ncbi:helix-turn-helix domain-containing protein [Halalkalicoccus sp. NIPERK01]|uniref:helix-turn-helix transcriptional regulator n=1 Tax=Halalkalicoccus sp. NIPERK01 TaxID=3053469 RepID=UPI00256E9EF3|nr:helix-turn-helix domain-containing protein [Halalkalicoccus sp. NIPERK01]MDL5362409.1 helix-turn-helix domain-containing protein [Halalkalicoccus sp. NIPERK01]